MSDSLWPHRWQATRLLRLWDSPGKNTGVGCRFLLQCMHATSLQLCPTLCNPMDSSPPGSSVHRILQARILEWGAVSFSNAWKWKVKVKLLSRVQLLATRWTAAYQAPPSTGFSRQEYWSGVPSPSPPSEYNSKSCAQFMILCNHKAGAPSLTSSPAVFWWFLVPETYQTYFGSKAFAFVLPSAWKLFNIRVTFFLTFSVQTSPETFPSSPRPRFFS